MGAADPIERGAAWLDAHAERQIVAAAPPAVALLPASSLKPERIRWLWDGWLAAGKLHLLAGRPGTGKTMLAVGLAATLSRGGRWPDGTASPRARTIIWTGEDGIADTLLPRFLAAGGDPDQLLFVGDAGGRPFDPAVDMPALAEAAADIADIGLLILDPVSAAVAADSHKNSETRRGLQPVVDLAERLGAAALGISHLSKGGAGREPMERVLGSVAFVGVSRVVMLAAARPETQGGGSVLMRAKSNIGPDEGGFLYEIAEAAVPGFDFAARQVVFGDRVDGHARDVLADIEAPDDTRAERDDAADWLVQLLRDGPRASTDIQAEAKAAGYSLTTLRRAKASVGVVAEKSAFGGGWRWRLPDHHPDSPACGRRAEDGHHEAWPPSASSGI